MYYVYILLLSNDAYYVGQTANLRQRIDSHDNGEVLSTVNHRPHRLVWYCAFTSKGKALAFEKYLKTASGKALRNKRLI